MGRYYYANVKHIIHHDHVRLNCSSVARIMPSVQHNADRFGQKWGRDENTYHTSIMTNDTLCNLK